MAIFSGHYDAELEAWDNEIRQRETEFKARTSRPKPQTCPICQFPMTTSLYDSAWVCQKCDYCANEGE